ncbi:flavin reductase family protein [Nocardia carnea]|uniref:flavin reductase family protein n=1 Tax=Nocardia carnea TaxID=37328 RepID=UPI0024578BCD|nr:flavin reductase family protein [Nocardia carnea]
MQDQDFRNLMAAVCAPVTVVTTADDEGPHGATVSSFASLSLHPPLVSVALDRRSGLLARIRDVRRFGVNVLGFADDETALLFSRRGEDRFAQVDWSISQRLPRLDGAAGWAVCDLWQVVEGGDHLLLIGLVAHAEATQRSPLVYGHRTFGTHSRFAERPRTPIVDTIAACAG